MFARATIFAISALVMTTNGAPAQNTCTNTVVNSCQSSNFVLSPACECCPTEGIECDDTKFFGQFCIPDPLNPKAAAKLDVSKLPLSCAKRQAAQTCTNACKPFEIRQDNCECCPVVGYECTHFDIGAAPNYCDASSKLFKERIAPSCPQRQTAVAPTCTTQCDGNWEKRNTLCDCCPIPEYTCAANAAGTEIASFKAKYCSGTEFKTTAFAPSCPLPTVFFDVSTCTTECVKFTYRSFKSCDCCPNIGEECKNGDLFCTNNKADAAKIPIACGANVQPLCSKFCPNNSLFKYISGANCDCCPLVGQECGLTYFGQYCDTSNNIVPSKIPDGCPTKDLFLKECKNSAGASLVCPPNTFKTTGCECCPVEGKECDPSYNGAYCNGNVVDLSRLSQSCPQRLKFKDCSKFTCPTDFTKNDKCECCPPVGFECFYGFCDSAGLFIRIPDGCPQTKAVLQQETQCDSTKYYNLFSSLKSFQYVNEECQICPFVGKECEGDNQALFCVSIAGFNTPDLSRIPSQCPQQFAQQNCPATLYTKNLIGECCPLKGKEQNAEYGGKYSTPDGKLIYANIPAGCPQYNVVAGCTCAEGYITPAGATNCECCPFPGFECDKRYNGKFCDLDGNLILDKLESICRPTKQLCDARYYFTGKDGFTCCPFEGKECEPVYGSKYCSTELGNAPWRQTVIPDKIPQVCNASIKQNSCSSRFINQNGYCCPLKGYECTVYYDNNQFCTNNKIDYSKIPFGCSQFEDVCLGANFERVPLSGTFKACCPKVTALSVANLCVDKFGSVSGKGGLFCDKDGAVLPEVTSVCSAAATTPTAETICGTDQPVSLLKYTFTDTANNNAKVCCPLSGFECIGSNKAMYCNANTGDIKNANSRLLAAAADVPFACPSNKAKIFGASVCDQASVAGKDLVIKQNKLGVIQGTKVCAQCPYIGKECTDETNFPYTDNKNAYCSRAFKTDSTTEYEYTLNIMSIDKLCPQRINGFSRIVATHFEKNAASNVYCPTSFAQGLGAFYSTFASPNFTLNPTLIPACDTIELNKATCTATADCPEQNYNRIKTGVGSTAESQCICCPKPDKNLCDPIFNNKYCLNNALIANAVPDQCLPPSNLPITRNQYFKCPKGVACGGGWVNSTEGCDCCPDFATKYTDAWCSTETVASELSDILCSGIGAGKTKRPAMDVVKLIPQSCTITETTLFPLVPVNDIVTRTGVQCPRIGTECSAPRAATDFCKKVDDLTVLDLTKIPVGCDQKTTNTGVCPVDACDSKYVTVPDKDFKDKAQYCQCCPKFGFECDPIYNNEFCDPVTKQILYEKIPSSCDQQKSTNACNFEFFYKNYKGSCCPIEGRECIKELGGFFCNEDGSFKKEAFLQANCDVPKCSTTCGTGFLQNGCYCCPVPFFELDPFYVFLYTGLDGSKIIPEECLTLNLFPKNPWDQIINYKLNDLYTAAKPTFEGLPPMGTIEGYKYVLNVTDVKDVFEVNTAKPAATLKEVMSKNIDYKINWATKGRVFGVNQVNQIYTILNTPALVTSIDAEIAKIEATSYTVPVPANLWEGLGVKDQAAFKALTSLTDKRVRFVTFWFNKPINECSKFGQQDRFYLGETNWLPATLTLDTAGAEYTLSKLIEELTYPKELTVEALLKVTKSQNISMDAYLKLDKVNRAYRMVKANLPATFDAAWHTTNKASESINSVETFFKSSVYWFDAKYPGLQIPPTVTGETAPVNAARAAVYTSYMAKIEPANAAVVVDTTDSDFSKPFEQYRMRYYMDLAVKEYVATNPTWDPQAYALKYSSATLDLYVYPIELKTWLRFSELNKIMDMVKEAEGWLVKYAAFLPATPTLAALFEEKILGSVINKIGLDRTKIQEVAATDKYSWKQTLFIICAYLDKNGQTLSDVYVPEYPAADLASYYLSSAVIETNNLSTRDVAFIYEGAKLIETDLGLDGQLAKRNADLLIAFEGSAEKLTAATPKEKAGRLMYFFYQKTRATLAKEVNGVIKPQPFSRYFYKLTETAVQTGFTAAKVSERDLYTGSQNAFSIALKVQTETFKADLTANAAAPPFIDAKYPQLKIKVVADTTSITDATLKTQAQVDAYAYYVATADIGLKPRSKSELDKYFPGASQSYLTRAKISEKDFWNIDQKVTPANTVLFRFNNDLVMKLGITTAVTGADAQEIVFRVNTAREYAEERIAYYEKLYKLPIVDHLRELGVTSDMLSDINLSFDQVADNPAQWNTELIGNMLFSQRYGKICKPSSVYVTACTTGWQSPLAVAEITIPLGLTQQIALTKQYSLLEVMNLSRQYVNWTAKDARKTNNIQELAKNNDPNPVALNLEFVKNYFDGEFLDSNKLVQRGYVCLSAATGATGVTDIELSTGPKVCDYLSNNQNTDVFRDKSRAETIVAPKTNIDIMRNSFHKKFTEANFVIVLAATFDAANTGVATAVHADYNFGNFIKAAAQFPAFCSVEDNKIDTVSCEKQIIGLLAVVGHYSSGFKDSLSAATTGCTTNNENTCLNAPAVETLEYHYISKLMKNSNIAIADAIYKAWGMGQISGPREFFEFFSRYPEVSAGFTGFTKPIQVPSLLTAANNAAPEMNWATAFYRWFQPSKVNFVQKEITESQDIGTGAKKYFEVENSYLVPSFDTLMLGNFGDFLGGATDFTTMFPTKQNGFRGIMKVLLGANCHSTAGAALTKTPEHTKLDAIYNALVAKWKDIDTVLDVALHFNPNRDCSAVGATSTTVNIPNIPKFNRKNYYAPTVTTIEPAPFFTVRQFQGTPGQCFNVHIETPYSIFSQDAYARCVAVKMLSTYGQGTAQGAAFDFSTLPGFTYYF